MEAENRTFVVSPTLADIVDEAHKSRKAILNDEDAAAYDDAVKTERREAPENF